MLCIKAIRFREEPFFVSASQDGFIYKWKVEEDWSTLIDKTKLMDGDTCMVFTISFVPNTGNKYFIAACDERIKLFDFESERVNFSAYVRSFKYLMRSMVNIVIVLSL